MCICIWKADVVTRTAATITGRQEKTLSSAHLVASCICAQVQSCVALLLGTDTCTFCSGRTRKVVKWMHLSAAAQLTVDTWSCYAGLVRKAACRTAVHAFLLLKWAIWLYYSGFAIKAARGIEQNAFVRVDIIMQRASKLGLRPSQSDVEHGDSLHECNCDCVRIRMTTNFH
jgi:hypothetical protein